MTFFPSEPGNENGEEKQYNGEAKQYIRVPNLRFGPHCSMERKFAEFSRIRCTSQYANLRDAQSNGSADIHSVLSLRSHRLQRDTTPRGQYPCIIDGTSYQCSTDVAPSLAAPGPLPRSPLTSGTSAMEQRRRHYDRARPQDATPRPGGGLRETVGPAPIQEYPRPTEEIAER